MQKEVMPDKDGVMPPEAETKKPLDQAAIDAVADEIALELSAAKEPEKIAKPEGGLSAEALERQRLVFEALDTQAGTWRERIAAVKTRKDLDAVKALAAKNGKYTTVPGFVVGNGLVGLLRDNAIDDAAEIAAIKERAYELQKALEAPYLAKQAELYPAQPAVKDTSVPSADPERAWMSRTEAFSLPLARHFPLEGVWYETLDGRRYHVTKKIGDPYHISGPDISGTPSISKEKILERAEKDGWRRSKNEGAAAPPVEDGEVVEPKEVVSLKQNLERAQELLQQWVALRSEYGADRLLRTVKAARNNGPVPMMRDVEDWLNRHSTLASLRGQANQEAQRFFTETALPDIEGVMRDIEANLEKINDEREDGRLAELEALSERLRAEYGNFLSLAEKKTGIQPELQARAHDIFGELTVMLEKEYSAYSQEKEADYREHRRHLTELIGELIKMKAMIGSIDEDPAQPEPVADPNLEAEASVPLLAIGEIAEFEKSIRRETVRRKVERTAEGYYLYTATGSRGAEPLDEIEVRKKLSSWRRVESEAVAPDLGPGFLEEGEIGEFTMDNSPVGSIRRFKREGGKYYQLRPDGSIGNPYSEAEIRELAKEVGLKRVVPETPESLEAAAKKAELLAALDAEVAKFRTEADNERAAYVAKKEEQEAAEKRISKIFRGIGFGGSLEGEVLNYYQFYEGALLNWKNAELERLRHRDLGREELRDAMAVLIREFEFEEAERLYEAERRVRMERTSKSVMERSDKWWAESTAGISKEDGSMRVEVAWSRFKYIGGVVGIMSQAGLEKAVSGVDKVGEGYNRLARGKYGKLILWATIVGAGAVAFGTGGTALAGVMAAKRMAAGAGFAVTARGVMDRYADRGRERAKADIMDEDRVRKVTRDVLSPTLDGEMEGKDKALNLEALSEYLEREGIMKAQSKARQRRVREVWRKGGAYVAGAAIGGLIPKEWFEGVGFGSAAHAATVGDSVQPAAEAASAPATIASAAEAASAPQDVAPSIPDASGVPAEIAPAPAAAPAEASALPGPDHIHTSPSVTLESQTKELLSSYTVKPGDSIWKIATKSVEGVPDMDKRSSGRFAKLLALKLEEKLTVIDPKLAEAAGFTVDAEGRFTPDHILAGAKLELGKLLSVEEMAELVEEAKSDNPITLPAAHPPASSIEAAPAVVPEPTEAERIAIEEARIEAAVPTVSPDERAEVLGQFNMSTELVGPKGDVMRYVGSLPREEQEHLFRNFRRITTALLQTNEVMGGEAYDMNYDPSLHPEFAKTSISRVVGDHATLGKNPFTSYDRLKNPLHYSQMEAVAKFSKAVAKAFGQSVAEPRAAESVQEYVLRMVAVAENQQVKIPGFRMVK